jgi:hypothetical protein
MPGKPLCRGAIGAAANRDGSRSDPELDAAVFTVLTAGRAHGLSALTGLASRLAQHSTTPSLHQATVSLPVAARRILFGPPSRAKGVSSPHDEGVGSESSGSGGTVKGLLPKPARFGHLETANPEG